jgi:hypothetical protein
MNDDNYQYSKAQCEWRGQPTWNAWEDDHEAQLRRDARFGGEALSRLMGCWDAPPKKPEPTERETTLDTKPQRPARPSVMRFGQTVLVEQYWGRSDWKQHENGETA